MARRIKNATLDSREARQKLTPRGKPYWAPPVERYAHVGYRRLKSRAGTWCARYYCGEQQYEIESLGVADDLSDADGVAILDFWQAQAVARQRLVTRAHSAAGKGPCTVEVAIQRYLQALEAKGRDPTDTAFRARAMIVPALGKIEISELTADHIRDWIKELVNAKPRVRTAPGQPQRYRKVAEGREGVRRRRSTVNRITAILKAALSHAYRDGLVSSDEAWRRVKLFENVSASRLRYLDVEEARRLLNACEPDFRNLVRAALLTGCRYSELCRARVSDFNRDSETIVIHQTKTGRSRHVQLTEEGVAFLSQLCAGRSGASVLLPKSNGRAWGASHQIPLMVRACACAKIEPPIGFHGLRHSYCSLSIMSGVPLLAIATNVGHSDLRMITRHYGHLSQSYVRAAIRAGAPRFGAVEATSVAALK